MIQSLLKTTQILNSIIPQLCSKPLQNATSPYYHLTEPLPLYHFTVLSPLNFTSPADTPFEDGTFKLTMTFTEEYPNKPPVVKFTSKMFHPNGLFTCFTCVLHICVLFIDLYQTYK